MHKNATPVLVLNCRISQISRKLRYNGKEIKADRYHYFVFSLN